MQYQFNLPQFTGENSAYSTHCPFCEYPVPIGVGSYPGLIEVLNTSNFKFLLYVAHVTPHKHFITEFRFFEKIPLKGWKKLLLGPTHWMQVFLVPRTALKINII